MRWGDVQERLRGRGAELARDLCPADLGVDEAPDGPAPYGERAGDLELERCLGGDAPLVVVAGARRAGTSRAAARVARAMLGDHLVVGHRDAADVPVADLVHRADAVRRRTGAPGVLVWRDGTGLATLDALTPALVDALPEGVRLVVTVQELLLTTWFPDPGTAALLTSPGTLVRLAPPPGGDPLGRVRVLMTPIGWRSLLPLALTRAATDGLRAGVPGGLPDDVLRAVAREHLGTLGEAALDDTAVRAVLDRTLRAAPVHGVRMLRRRAGRVVPPAGATVVADGGSTASWPLSPAVVRVLADALDPAGRDVVARTLLLRGEVDLVPLLVDDGWGAPTPEQATALAAARRALEARARAERRREAHRDRETRRRAERAWALVCHEFARAAAALPLAVDSADVEAAWSWLARLEATDPPGTYATTAARWRVRVEEITAHGTLETRRAACDQDAAARRREHAEALDAALARECRLRPVTEATEDAAPTWRGPTSRPGA